MSKKGLAEFLKEARTRKIEFNAWIFTRLYDGRWNMRCYEENCCDSDFDNLKEIWDFAEDYYD